MYTKYIYLPIQNGKMKMCIHMYCICMGKTETNHLISQLQEKVVHH